MRYLFISLFFFSFLSKPQGQDIEEGSLWQATTIYDTLGNKYEKETINEFILFENELHMLRLEMKQLMDNKTGEMIVSYTIEGNNLKKEEKSFKIAELNNHAFQIINSDSIFYKKEKYGLAFRRINTVPKNFSNSELKTFLSNHKVTEVLVNPFLDEEKDKGYIIQYQSNGKVRYQDDPTRDGWESDYRIINFGDFVFIKGITSWPKLVEKLEKEKLVCQELENRKPVRNLEIRIIK